MVMPVAAEGSQEENVPHKNQQKGPSWEPVKPEDNHVNYRYAMKHHLACRHSPLSTISNPWRSQKYPGEVGRGK